MLKREWVRKATGSYRIYWIPSKIAALVPEFAVEELPSAELQPRFLRLQWRTCLWAEHWWYIYSFLLPFLFHLIFTLSYIGFALPRLTAEMPMGSNPYRGAHTLDQNTRQIHKGSLPWNMRSAEWEGHLQRRHDRTQRTRTQSQDRKNFWIARNRIRAAGLEVSTYTPWRRTNIYIYI